MGGPMTRHARRLAESLSAHWSNGHNSPSTIAAAGSQSRVIAASSAAVRRKFSGATIAPARTTPKKDSTHSNPFWARSTTRSPGSTPRDANAPATREARASSSP
jgi:hypothetical protein